MKMYLWETVALPKRKFLGRDLFRCDIYVSEVLGFENSQKRTGENHMTFMSWPSEF